MRSTRSFALPALRDIDAFILDFGLPPPVRFPESQQRGSFVPKKRDLETLIGFFFGVFHLPPIRVSRSFSRSIPREWKVSILISPPASSIFLIHFLPPLYPACVLAPFSKRYAQRHLRDGASHFTFFAFFFPRLAPLRPSLLFFYSLREVAPPPLG